MSEVNRLSIIDMENAETECCSVFVSKPWDDNVFAEVKKAINDANIM